MAKATVQEVREALLKGFDGAQTETEVAKIRADLMATMTDKEMAIYLDNNKMATEIVHLKHTFEAVKEKYEQAVAMAVAFGFPTTEKVKTVSGDNTVQINTTVKTVDTDRLKQDCLTYTKVAEGVALAIENKRAKITVDSLTDSDLKGILSEVPKKDKKQTKVYVREA